MVGMSFFIQPSGIIHADKQNIIADFDTPYSRNWIFQYQEASSSRTVQILTNSIYGLQSGMYVDNPHELVFSYLKMFDIAFKVHPEFKNNLLIGGSSYSYPKFLLNTYKDKTIDVVEIDPDITQAAKKYFALRPDPRLAIIHQDGRIFLNHNNKKYDAIFIDAFSSYDSIPFQLTTQEAVVHVAQSLNDKGLVTVNIISGISGEQSGFLASEYATYKSVFSYVYLLRMIAHTNNFTRQNVILVASQTPIDLTQPALHDYRDKYIETPPSDGIILTDNFAPVEKYVSDILF